MKTLVLVRHAKSSWSNPALDDFERPLNKRGEKNAPQMGKRLKAAGHEPDILVSSPAVRARTTAEIISNELEHPVEDIVFDDDLYHASREDLLEAVHALGSGIESAMLFGHNPGMTDFANYLTGEFVDNVPTTGTVHIEFPANNWSEIKKESGTLVLFDYPKRTDER